MNAEVQIFENRSAFWESVISYIKKISEKSSGNFRVAASGGSAAEVFSVAATAPSQLPVNWEIWQTDERFVPPTHPDSNQKLLQEKIGNTLFHPFPILKTPEESVRAYADKLQEDSEGFLFDCTILGVGPDGHTASLFPHSPALDETHNLTAHTTTNEFAVHDRLTLTFPALQKSKHILVLLLGESKQAIFGTITNPATSFHEYPARALLDMNQAHVWWCKK